MSNYSSLKSTINANIKQNGNEEITGPILNSVLNAMVDSLAGYHYSGIATPATNPGTPDSNVFYIASDAGTYTNFGGLAVAEGEVAILKYNGSWTKEVTGAATAAEVSQLSQEVAEIAIPITESGKYIKLSDGPGASVPSTTNNASYLYSRYPVSPGDTVIVNGVGASGPRLWGFVDANNKILNVSEAGVTGDNLQLVAPANSAEIIINSTIAGYGVSYYLSKNSIQGQLNWKTAGVAISSPSVSETTGKFINRSGSVGTTSGAAYTSKFFVARGDKISLSARGYLTNVAMISKVVTENTEYIPMVVSIDSSLHTYEYIADEDGYYACSFFTSLPHYLDVIANTPNVLSERINILADVIGQVDPTSKINDGLYQGIPVIGMIGDSLMSGAGYDPNTGSVHDNIEYAWWKTLERKSGMTYRRFCRGGMSTFAFVSDTTYGLPVALTAGNECNLYIVGLEINDRNNYPNDLGTSSDIDLSNPDNNANTFYGNYGKIIQKITAFNPGCKFILFTNPRSDGAWNDAIRTISGMFSNAYLVDLYAMYSQYYEGDEAYFNRYKDSSAHYPAMAYKAMAKLLEAAIDKCINDNYTEFRDIQYQG